MVILLKAFKRNPNAVLVICAKPLLSMVLGRVTENYIFRFYTDKIFTVGFLYLVKVSNYTGIVHSFTFCYIDIPFGVGCYFCLGNVVINPSFDESTHLLLIP